MPTSNQSIIVWQRTFQIVFGIISFSIASYSQIQPVSYRCDCAKIGLDSVWADTNKVSCYLIPVERNFTKPRDKEYHLAVATVPAIANDGQDPVLYLHGGPGIATLENMPRYLKSKTFSKIRINHPLVFFDYRGTGFSEPAFCETLNDSVNTISSLKKELESQINMTIAAYRNCNEEILKKDIQVTDFSSLQSAADAESIRNALGITKWNIYSVSHGTTVALNMMRTFPKKIRSVILDSPFPTNAPWIDFIHPFDTCFKFLENYIKADSLATAHFPDIRKDFNKITTRLQATPFEFPVTKSTGQPLTFNASDFCWSVWSAMLDPSTIPLVPIALKEIAAGNDSVLARWALVFSNPDAFGKFALAQSKAILLYETKPRFREETEEYLLKNYPDFAYFITPGIEAILFNEFRPQRPPKKYFNAVKSKIPVLIYAGEFDPVCPPLFAQATARKLSNPTTIIVPAASHAAMFVDDCTRNIGTEFFLNPHIKPVISCLKSRKKIEFVSSDILKLLK